MLQDAAAYIAPGATTLAACMTAANLGPRVTGWGFIVFSVGAVAWASIGLSTGQANLVWQNAILLVIDFIGIWRWLGREARYVARAEAAEAQSRTAGAPTLVSGGRLSGLTVTDRAGSHGEVVDALIESGSGRIVYLMVREGGLGGVGERLRRLDWTAVQRCGENIQTEKVLEDLPLMPEPVTA